MRTIEHLNFNWKYKADYDSKYESIQFDDKDFETVNIPHCNKELPYNNFDERKYQFESCYRKTFIPASDQKGKLIFLCFDGIMNYAKVYIN